LWPAEFNYSGCDHRGLLCKSTILTTAIPAWRRLERSDLPVTRVGVDLGSRMESWLSSPQAGGTGGPCAAANGSLYCGRLSSCTDSSRGISIYVSALTLVYQLALLAEFMKFSPQSLSSVTSKSRSNCFEISFLRSLLLSHHVARTVCNVSPTIQEFVRR